MYSWRHYRGTEEPRVADPWFWHNQAGVAAPADLSPFVQRSTKDLKLNDFPATLSVFTKKMAVGCPKQKLNRTKMTEWLFFSHSGAIWHHLSSCWTVSLKTKHKKKQKEKNKARHQYKNIVQQFSCHSKHSYLSNTSAAIHIKQSEHRETISESTS